MSKLTEEQIRIVAHLAKEELGDGATLEKLRDVVQETVKHLEKQDVIDPVIGKIMAVLMSFDGLENSRILSDAIKETGCKITERFEKNLAGFSVLLAIIEEGSCRDDFQTLRQRLSDAGNRAGVRIILQTENTLRNVSKS